MTTDCELFEMLQRADLSFELSQVALESRILGEEAPNAEGVWAAASRMTSSLWRSIGLCAPPPRSCLRSCLETAQPSFSAPTRPDCGTRTSVKNTSHCSGAP